MHRSEVVVVQDETEETLAAYLSSRDAFRGPALEQHLLLQRHLLSKRFLVKCLPQVCPKKKTKQNTQGSKSGDIHQLEASAPHIEAL